VRRLTFSPAIGARRAGARRTHAGFSLIEVLVAILIFGVGMLGVAAMQLRGLATSTDSGSRGIALALAGDLADRMRANLAAVNVANAAARYDGVAPNVNDCRMRYAASQVAVPNACTPAQLAADDLADWSAQLAQALPGAIGVVCRDTTPEDGTAAAPACDGAGNLMVVKVFWTGRETSRANAAQVDRRLVLAVRP